MRIATTDLFRLGKCLIDGFVNSYSTPPSVIILDCDDTNNDTYGQQELAQVTIESAKREFNQYQKPVKRYHSFMYKAGSWKNYQRVIVKVEVSTMGTNIRHIVINLNDFRTRDLYEKGYCTHEWLS